MLWLWRHCVRIQLWPLKMSWFPETSQNCWAKNCYPQESKLTETPLHIAILRLFITYVCGSQVSKNYINKTAVYHLQIHPKELDIMDFSYNRSLVNNPHLITFVSPFPRNVWWFQRSQIPLPDIFQSQN